MPSIVPIQNFSTDTRRSCYIDMLQSHGPGSGIRIVLVLTPAYYIGDSNQGVPPLLAETG